MTVNERDGVGLGKILDASIGRADFVESKGLRKADKEGKIDRIVAQAEEAGIEVVRFSIVDSHGQLRSRPIELRHFRQAALNGVPFTSALFAMDSSNHIFLPIFSADGGFGRSSMGGAGDMLAVADLDTFHILPWTKNSAIILADLYLSDGEPCPLDPRSLMRKALSELGQMGLSYVGGVEIEFHIFKVKDARLGLVNSGQPADPMEVEAYRHGYQHMSQLLLDEYEPVIDAIRQTLIKLNLPVRTVECEWGPSQLEITLDPLLGLEAADAVVLLRNAIKQLARRMGLMASFMAKPGLPNIYSCGWHLHESLVWNDGCSNAFASPDQPMSKIAKHFVGGLLKHARAGTAFSNPTINGYKRLNANQLAPKRAVWSIDNKGAMCRLIGGAGDRSTHIENRSGEPAANPYLYIATQIFAGIDGIRNEEDPGEPTLDPCGQNPMPLMPKSLMEAVEALAGSAMFRKAMGNEFVDHFVAMKRYEIERFLSYVTDWEHREYFEAF